MKQRRAFGELEFAVLEIVRKHEKVSVKAVHDSLSGSNSYTTVMTVMSRLFEKGILMREKAGRSYEYWLSQQKACSELNLLQRVKRRIFGGKSSEMISYLLENDEKISADELEKIAKIIRKFKRD